MTAASSGKAPLSLLATVVFPEPVPPAMPTKKGRMGAQGAKNPQGMLARGHAATSDPPRERRRVPGARASDPCRGAPQVRRRGRLRARERAEHDQPLAYVDEAAPLARRRGRGL